MRPTQLLKILFAAVPIAITSRAQVTSTDNSAKHSAVAVFNAAGSAQTPLPTLPGVEVAGRFPLSRWNTEPDGPVPMDSNPPIFLPPVIYDPGGNAVSVAIVEVNLDGKPDVVVVHGNCPASVGILLGNGDGTFQPAVSYDSGGCYAAVVVADVNRDGKPDLVVANGCGDVNCFTGGSVGVLLGNGDGTFQPVVTYPGFGGKFLATGDFNGDGKPDLVVVPLSSNPVEVGVLLGNGDGTFQSPITYSSGGEDTDGVTIADVNNDGKPDLVVANGSGTIGILLGNGDGTFQPAVTYSSGGMFFPETDSPVVADVNGDGKPDVVVGNSGSGTVGLLLGNGNGTFQPVVTYPSVSEPLSVVVADVNGDGVPDVLMAGEHGYGVALLLGKGNGTFEPLTSQSVPGAQFLAVGDLNGDGKPDLAVGMDAVGVMLNNSGAPPTTTSLVSNVNPARANHTVTYTATVKGQSGSGVTGTVIFQEGGSTVATVTLSGNQAAYSTSYKTTGTHVIVASYSGDLQNASSSASLTELIFDGYRSTTALRSSLNPSIYGQKVTWTATVTSSGSVTPTGTVRFKWNGYLLGSATLNGGGVATLTKSKLNADPYPIIASYVGDVSNGGSTSAVLNQAVVETTSSATLASSPNPSTKGQAVTFTAKISSPTVTPSGPVTFTAGKTVLGAAQLSGGKATLTTLSLAVGSTKVTATYNGDSNIVKSSASVTQTVH